VGVGGRGPGPGHVVVEGQTLVAVGAGRVVLADAHASPRPVRTRSVVALGRVSVALAPGDFDKIIYLYKAHLCYCTFFTTKERGVEI